MADWDVSSDDCADKKEIIEKTKKAAPAAFASANDRNAPFPSTSSGRTASNGKGYPQTASMCGYRESRRGRNRSPPVHDRQESGHPFFDVITHELSHHADSTLSEADADAVMAA